MRSALVKLLAACALVLCLGCAGAQQPAATVLNATAMTVDTAIPVLHAEFRRQGKQLVDESLTEDEALVKLSQHAKKWAPLWGALDLFAQLHDSAADLVESGQPVSLQHLSELVRAYCKVREILHDMGEAEWPDVPVFSCEGSP